MTDDTLDDARHEVLAENTAQAVHKHLSKLFQEEFRFRNRWVWELLQNARDASPEDGVSVWLIHKPDRVIFRHSGVPFTHKSIAHLIYHGSTKYDLSDSGPIGQFGTGFLTTHLISKTVKVKGRTDDGKHFDFLLDRRGDNADELQVAMDASWDAFIETLTKGTFEETGGFTTEYEYPLASDIVDVVKEGIADLIANAAYLLAFNGRIRSLHVEQPDRSVTIEKRAALPLGDEAHLLHIEECATSNDPVSRYVATITNDNGTSVAVEVAKVDGNWTISKLGETPRIFVAFPLTRTRDFCLPAVINHEKFRPHEDRDTLVLKANREGKHPNMILVEEACDLAARLAVLAMEKGWDGAATLVRLNELREWDWVDADWLRELLATRFIQPLRSRKLMTTVNGEKIAPAAGMLPLPAGSALCFNLWDIMSQFKGASGRLPRRDETHIWADNLTSWAPFLSQSVEELPESLTLQKLCEEVSEWGTVAEVGSKLSEAVDPIEWLNQLHALISKAEHIELFDHMRLIPSQSGKLKKITELRRDPGIDEELKHIVESLDLPTRDELLDQRMRLEQFSELQAKTEEEVLRAAVQKFKDQAKAVDAAFVDIAVHFFVWLVRHDKIDNLDGFPVLTRTTGSEEAAVVALFRDPNKIDERTLAPTGCWPEAVRSVAYLFPKRQTLSDAYYEALPDDASWGKLAEQGYVRLSPLYRTRRRVPFIPDEPLPVSEKDKKLKHRTEDPVEVSALAFFEQEETGLDAVRRSKIRAVGLLHFLTHFVLEEDIGALEAVQANCECGEKHRHYGAAWLVPMWERRWVPLGDSKQSSATAETIAQLFKGREEELRHLTVGKGRKLLEALSISIADLSLRAVAEDEDARISLIDSLANIVRAADNDVEKVKLVAEEIRQSPGLLDQIREHRETRKKVQRNQLLGAEVERLLKEELQGHGLKVTRTGKGSDYEVEEDYVVGEEEVIIAIDDGRRPFLIEIKATTGNVVRMTATQAKTAVENRDRFILCIVRLDSPDPTAEIVRERCRFVMDIGYQVEPVWAEYDRLQEAKTSACIRVGDVELMVQEGEVRFAVGDRAWENGRLLEVAVEEILGAFREERGA